MDYFSQEVMPLRLAKANMLSRALLLIGKLELLGRGAEACSLVSQEVLAENLGSTMC